MSRRNEIILNTFADWSVACQAEYVKRYESPLVLGEIESAKAQAIRSYETHRAFDSWDQDSEHRATKDLFYSDAARYFLLGVQYGQEMVEIQLYLQEEHSQKWDGTRAKIMACNTFQEVGGVLREKAWLRELLETTTSVRATSLPSLKRKILERLKAGQAYEYESEFGQSVIYEELGRASAIEHFKDQRPNRRGPPRKRFGNPDAYRALQLGKIVKSASEALLAAGLEPTTVSELCEMTHGEGAALQDFDRAKEIRWAYVNYFRAANISVAGFLNSISRGNAIIRDNRDRF